MIPFQAKFRWFDKRYSIVFTGVVLFILTFGLAIFQGYRQFETTRNNVLNTDKTTANLLSDLILAHNEATIGILQSYAHRPLFVAAVKNKNLAEAYRHLSDLKKNAYIDLTFVTDKRGILWANFPVFSEAIGNDLSSRDWYKGISSRWKPYISPVFKLIVGDKPLAVAVCVPIFDEKERPIGILANSQRLSFLVDTMQRVHLIPYTTVNVIDQAGHILYSNKFPYQENITDYRSFPVIEAAIKGKKQQIEMNDPQKDQEKNYLTVVPVGNIGWTVILERSLRDIFHSDLRLFIEIGAVSFILFLLIIFFLVYLRKDSLFRKELAATKISEDAAREYAESIINTVREPLIALDQDLRVVSVSRSFYEFFKVKPEETVGQLIYDLGNKQWNIPKLRELLETILPQEATFDNYEVEHDFATIGRRIMLLNARQIQRVLGKERIILLAIEDITEKKKLEREMVKARDTAEAVNKELETFSYSVSHDLRAPLRGIDGFSQALLEDYRDKLDATGKNYLERIRAATQHMGNLIDDMLKLSRVTRAEFKRESVDLSKMVQDILLTVRQNNPARDVKATIQKDIIVDGDRHLLELALTNLMDNAWKFTGKTKKAHIEFGTELTDGKPAMFLRDNGVGFDMLYVDKLFGVFQRLHAAEEFSGTGIGLANVQRVIHRHGGEIWAEGEVGKGATFYFTIPA